MQRFAVVDNLDAAWCSVQRGTVFSVAHKNGCTARKGVARSLSNAQRFFVAVGAPRTAQYAVKSVAVSFFFVRRGKQPVAGGRVSSIGL
jgi:hypothetical protein